MSKILEFFLTVHSVLIVETHLNLEFSETNNVKRGSIIKLPRPAYCE